MSHISGTQDQPSDTFVGETSHQTEFWNDISQLNPCSDPWFPNTESSFDLDFQGIPDLDFDASLFWSHDYLPDLSYLPPFNYHLEPMDQHSHHLATHAPNESVDQVREGFDKLVAELLQVKTDLENKVQLLQKTVEETQKASRDLRIDVNATEKWCQQLQAFIENNWPNFSAELCRSSADQESGDAETGDAELSTGPGV